MAIDDHINRNCIAAYRRKCKRENDEGREFTRLELTAEMAKCLTDTRGEVYSKDRVRMALKTHFPEKGQPRSNVAH